MARSLSETDITGFKNKLLDLRARLRGDVSTMAEVALNHNRVDGSGELSSIPVHLADVGSDNYDQEFTLALMESESGMLANVDEALKRIDDETYGDCEDCGKAIPKARLNAIPYASKCVKCASESEQR
ncbi:MAG: TraR/DksA family transcriptional regulator [Thermoguttaceae bacterium]